MGAGVSFNSICVVLMEISGSTKAFLRCRVIPHTISKQLPESSHNGKHSKQRWGKCTSCRSNGLDFTVGEISFEISLELILEDPDSGFFVQRAIQIGTACRFLRDINDGPLR